jgi:hypothetical protein
MAFLVEKHQALQWEGPPKTKPARFWGGEARSCQGTVETTRLAVARYRPLG